MGSILKIRYVTTGDREQILAENSGNKLIEEQNITEGDFLVFEDLSQDRYVKNLEDQILLMADQADGGIL